LALEVPGLVGADPALNIGIGRKSTNVTAELFDSSDVLGHPVTPDTNL